MQPVTKPCVARRAPVALGLIGFSAVIGQIILLRELIVVFNGNEISMGIMMATWLLWTAAGSRLASSSAFLRGSARRMISALECLLSASLPSTIWALRASRVFFQTVPGESVGPVPMVLTSLGCLSAFCVLSGALFVVAARMYQEECVVPGGVAAGSAYMLEAAGSGFGGILASAVLLRFLDSFQIATLLALLNLGMAAILWFGMSRKLLMIVALATVVTGIPLLRYLAPSLNRSTQKRLWERFQVLASRDSIYGNLAVVETGNIRSIYDNGVILASAPDENAAEEAVHYALLQHAAPRKVLLIGGGVNGSIAQALKHPTLEQLDYVELDPVLISMIREFFPAQSAASLSDPRVHIHYTDGRYYLKTAGTTFDVIILALPDPQTAQLNRFYTVEFFRSARDHLKAGGVLAFELRSSEDYISLNLAEFLRCVQWTLRQVFPYVVIIPGATIHFFAAQEPNVLTDDPQILIARLESRHLETQYVREYFIPFRMTPDRMVQVRELLRPLPTTPVNRDFEPIAYYFDVVLWSTQFKLGYSRWFPTPGQTGFASILDGVLVVSLFLAVVLAYLPKGERHARGAAAYCVFATGFTLMTLQILVLLGFQSVYGYVYRQLAILIAMFMAGIAWGSWLGIRRTGAQDRRALWTIGTTQALLAVSGPVLVILVRLLSEISSVAATLVAAQLVFPALAALAGILGGFQFPMATSVYLRGSSPGASLGTVYALDLLGGCLGAVLLSSYLIPLFGFWRTAWFSAAVNLAPALLAVRVSLGSKVSQA